MSHPNSQPTRHYTPPSLSAATTICVFLGLTKPLVNIPVVGSEKYINTTMGGWTLTWIIVGLLLISTMLMLFRHPCLRQCSGILAGIAWGLLAGTILSFYRWAADVIRQLGQGEEMIRQTTLASGSWWLIAGFILWLISLISSRVLNQTNLK